MRGLCLLVILGSIIIFSGCTKEPEYKKAKLEVIDKTRAYRNPLLPNELRSKLLEGIVVAAPETKKEEKKESKEENKSEEKEEKKEENKSEDSKSILSEVGPDGFARMRVTVYLVEKTQGVLKHLNYEIQYGPGGGALDLMEYVDDQKKGTFYFAIEPDLQEEGDLSVWYVSNAKTRKLRGESVGSGCSSYFDITKHFKKEMKKSGFMVNTTEQRYVSALAGQYYLKIKNDKRVSIAIIDVSDSRHHELECR